MNYYVILAIDFRIRNLMHIENELDSSIYEVDTEGIYEPFDASKTY